MIKKRRVNPKVINYVLLTALFIIGIFMLAARNPDPFINPIIYAEDGEWAGLGLTNGWMFALTEARNDYFAFLNIALLFLATKISVLVSGNPITLLPESITITSFAFFSAVAIAVFVVTKNIAPTIFRLALYLLLLLIPLGTTQNEIIGRILQVGFYVPLISVLLFFLRDNSPSKHGKHAIDFFVLLCAATNPVVFALAFLYLSRDFFKDFDLRACIKRNLTLIIPLGLLLAVLLPRMGGKGGIPGEFVSSNFIEAIIARPIAYPFIFPWYSELSDRISLVFFAIWLCFIVFSYTISKNPAARRLILFLMAAILVYDLATIVMRPGLTGFLSNYQTTFPDRYFMGLNVLAIFLTMIALSQISIAGNIAYKIFSYFTLSIVTAVYAWHALDIFEIHASKTPLKGRFDFSEQVCLSEPVQKGLRVYPEPGTTPRGKRLEPTSTDSVIQIYPGTWIMVVPNRFIDKSDCKYTSLDDAGIADTQDLYKILPTPQLDAHSPIKIKMTSSNRDDQVGLKRIGVRFGTNARQNPGEAELRLKDPDGSEIARRFSLPDLADNKYRYFDLDSRRYTSGQIVSITGGGIATWESHDEKGGVNTCIIYEYNNGKRRSTPGCPF